MRLAFYADELTTPVEEEPGLPQAEQLSFESTNESTNEHELNPRMDTN